MDENYNYNYDLAGLVYADLELPDGEGGKAILKVTGRGKTLAEAIDDLMDGVMHAGTEYGAVLVSQKTASVTAKPQAEKSNYQQSSSRTNVDIDDGGNELERFKVEGVTPRFTQNGQLYLAIHGGWFMKFGLKGWIEKLPADIQEMLPNLEVGVRLIGTNIPDSLGYVIVNDKNVVRFEPKDW
jgi:hypothetical protein